MNEVLARLAAANIQLLSAVGTTHLVFGRDGFAALVERREDGFGSIGAPGLLTDHGLAMLVWRGPNAHFVARGFEQSATAEQVAGLRAFGSDLAAAIQQG